MPNTIVVMKEKDVSTCHIVKNKQEQSRSLPERPSLKTESPETPRSESKSSNANRLKANSPKVLKHKKEGFEDLEYCESEKRQKEKCNDYAQMESEWPNPETRFAFQLLALCSGLILLFICLETDDSVEENKKLGKKIRMELDASDSDSEGEIKHDQSEENERKNK